MKHCFFFIAVLLSVYPLSAQQFRISGQVLDAETRQPLAFVNIVVNNSNTGGVSDIDGWFAITASEPVKTLHFSYVGYTWQTYDVQDGNSQPVILLEKQTLSLPEVVIVAGVNPAHRIIENAIRNRDRNNYERLPSFAYTSYDKMIFTVEGDTLNKIDSLSADTSMLRLKEFIDRQHLFIMETVAERRFLYPGRNHQKVTASRISGFRDPIFTFLISQLQSTSFYTDVISISDKNYVNPISRGSTGRYSFILEDTLFHASAPTDTTFIVSYNPKPSTNFDGLRGLLYINSNGWAIANVIAEPERQEQGMIIRIQQMYERINDLYWFPVQLNTDIVFKNVLVNNLNPVGQGKSYISNIVVSPDLVRRMFNEVSVEVDPFAGSRSAEEWERLRAVSLTGKDLETYRIIDSLGKAHNFDRFAAMAETLFSGQIPLGYFNIPLNRLLRFNEHEKLYAGFGLTTNRKVSRVFSVGAYAGYGFGDKKLKYGSELKVYLKRQRDFEWFATWSNDVSETGMVDPFVAAGSNLMTDYRSLRIRKMDRTKTKATGLQYRLFPYLLTSVGFHRSNILPQYEYTYSGESLPGAPESFIISELNLTMRFAFREKILQTSRTRISLGTKYPELWFRFAQAFDGFPDRQYAYRRYDFKMQHSAYFRFFGKTSVLLRAGMIDGPVPYFQLYSGFGNYDRFTIYSPGSFATMRINEFTADRYTAVFLTHNFGKLLLRTKRFEPEFVVASHAGFGWLKKQDVSRHSILLQSFEKGYFESGLLVNNLLNLQFFNLGAGAFYRYGSYALNGFKQNISVQMSINFSF